ncbi:hypothetical protein AAGG49_21830, partial [Stenotrophomonas maltophilia]|uniref:hypothetical protein n=1 Tax=Stenotrophomonas maltophilia TaxID=40324 RepID=UPI00313C1AA9
SLGFVWRVGVGEPDLVDVRLLRKFYLVVVQPGAVVVLLFLAGQVFLGAVLFVFGWVCGRGGGFGGCGRFCGGFGGVGCGLGRAGG